MIFKKKGTVKKTKTVISPILLGKGKFQNKVEFSLKNT